MQSLQLIINIFSKKFSTSYEIKVVDKAIKLKPLKQTVSVRAFSGTGMCTHSTRCSSLYNCPADSHHTAI